MANESSVLVSIIMGAYNCENTIGDSIDSIIAQTYKNWELIICDDCSTDRTADIIKHYADIDSRIICIKNTKNMKLAASLNSCLEIAKGTYIARMDADDLCEPNRIMRQVEYLDDNPDVHLVGTNMMVFDSTGNRGVRRSEEYPTKESMVKYNPIAHPTVMIRADVYKALGGYRSCKDTNRCEDLDLWFRFFASGYNAYNLQEPLYRFRENIDDLTRRDVQSAIGIFKVLLKGYSLLGIPFYKRVWAFKPILSAIVPKRIMNQYYKKQLK